MGKVEIDHTGSGSGITLSSDGTSLLLDGTAIGGGGGASAQTIDIKTADYTVVSGDLGKIIKYFGAGVDRTVTLTAGATLGEGFHVTILNANSGADERVVIDANSTETFGWSNGPQTITLSRGELVRIIWDNTGGRWIIGEGGFNLSMRSDINPATTTAAGDGANGAIALGLSSLATGSQAISLGKSLASNSYAFAASIANNTSSYGASGANSIAMVKQAKATGSTAIALGWLSQSTAAGSVVIGSGAGQATATGAVSIGGYIQAGAKATGVESMALGNSAVAAEQGKLARSCGHFGAAGDAQGGQFILRADTTDATATVLTTNNSTAGSTNQIVAASDTCITFDGTITAMQNGAQAYASWKIEGLLVNDGGTTTLANSATTVIQNLSSWGMALSADNTNNALAITVTGEAAHNIRWVANIRTTEVTYA